MITRILFPLALTMLSYGFLACTADPTDATDRGATAPPAAGRPLWLQGMWVHDDGYYTPYYLTIDSDGTFDWQSGVDDISGNWSSDGSTLSFDSYQAGVDFEFMTGCHVISLEGKDYFYAFNQTSDCPRKPAPFTPLEKCAIGTFHYTNSIGATYRYELDDDRTYIENEYYDGYETSGGYNVYGSFAVDTSGSVNVTHTNGKSDIRLSLARLAGSSRDGAIESGCDIAAFDRLTTTTPAQPTNLQPSSGATAARPAVLGWSSVSGAENYDLEIFHWTGSAWVQDSNQTIAAPLTTFTLYENAGIYYSFSVAACNSAGCSAWSDWAQFLGS